MDPNPTYKSVFTEDCNICYWYQGTGPLLIFIPGGGGIGRYFDDVIPYLDQAFTCCTFDRRQNGASQVMIPKQLNPVQQARDVVAIIKDMGQEKASIFGSSAGALLAMQLAASYPQYLDRIIAHEAPTIVLLDDATSFIDRVYMLQDTYRTQGLDAAQNAFNEWLIGYESDFKKASPSREDFVNFWDNEFTLTLYCPSLDHIVRNKVAIAVGAGIKSGEAMYARTTKIHAEKLGCRRYMFPGHHQGYRSEPEAFAKRMMEALEDLKEKR